MKKVSLDTWIQLLGMVGLLGGLIFVGLEMKQSQQIALAAQQTERTNMLLDQVNSFSEPELNYHKMLLMQSGQMPPNPEYEWMAVNTAHGFWWIAENDFVQYSLGLMDENIWQAKLNAMEFVYNSCLSRHVFDFRKSLLDARLVSLIEDFPDACTN